MNTGGDFKTGDDPRRNSKGRPKAGKSIAEYVRRKTKNGRALIDFYCKVFEDTGEVTENRLKAAQRLEERGFGKAPQTIATEDGEFAFNLILQANGNTNGVEHHAGASGLSFHFGGSNGAG